MKAGCRRVSPSSAASEVTDGTLWLERLVLTEVFRMNNEESSSDPELPSFPVFPEPMRVHLPVNMSWAEVVRYFEPLRKYYMEHYDSPERRLADKVPEPFRLD